MKKEAFGARKRNGCFYLSEFGQQRSLCFEKSCGGREESSMLLMTVALICFQVSRCLICEVGIFPENVTSRMPVS